MEPLELFRPETRAWFERNFAAPTPAQDKGWPAIAGGGHVLIQAPTGSGKTLAAFLSAIDRLTEAPGKGLRVLYVSPLKALNYDVERNLRGPLAGLRSELRVGGAHGRHAAEGARRNAARAARHPDHDARVALPAAHRRGRASCSAASTLLILDEVHAVAGTKRGAHLALSLERLEALAARPPQRIGLSATQRPLEEIGRFVSGGRPIELVDAGVAKELDLEVVVPVEDMREPGGESSAGEDGAAGSRARSGRRSTRRSSTSSARTARRSCSSTTAASPSGSRCRLNELAEEEIARAHHGSLAREQRTQIEEDLKAGRIPCLVATSSLELGIDMGAVDLVIQVESPKSVARGLQRIGRAGHSRRRGLARAHLPEVPRRPARVGRRRAAHARRR